MKRKVSELTGIALDYAVATAEGAVNFQYDTVATYWVTLNGEDRALRAGWSQSYLPSTNWDHGGPIIEREQLNIEHHKQSFGDGVPRWHAVHPKNYGGLIRHTGYGPTLLVAAMRCYVCRKLGDTIDIPGELP